MFTDSSCSRFPVDVTPVGRVVSYTPPIGSCAAFLYAICFNDFLAHPQWLTDSVHKVNLCFDAVDWRQIASGQWIQLSSGLLPGKKYHNSPSKDCLLSIHSKTHLPSQHFLQDSTFGRTAWSRTTWGHPKQSDVSGRRRKSLKKIYEYMNPSRNNDLIYYDCKGFMSKLQACNVQILRIFLGISTTSRCCPSKRLMIDVVFFSKNPWQVEMAKNTNKRKMFFVVRYEGLLVMNSLVIGYRMLHAIEVFQCRFEFDIPKVNGWNPAAHLSWCKMSTIDITKLYSIFV